MNSKNNLRKAAAFVVFITMQHILFAQTFQYSAQKFNISLPSLSITNPWQTSPPPYYTLFIETGDGRYYKDSSHIISADITTPWQIPYNFTIPSAAILNIVGHYDTIKPPRELYTITPSYSASDAPVQNTLAPNQKIGFAYADRNVVLGDTMTYVITYKPDPAYTVVAFFYNDNSSFGRQKVFTEITNQEQTYPFVVSDGSTNPTHQDIKAIRAIGVTSISTTIPDGIPSRVTDSLVSARGSFNNVIYFWIPSAQNSDERNAFISMIAPLNSNLIGSFANIKAILIRYTKNYTAGYISQQVITDVLPIGQFASDPNGIRTTPHCLDSLHGEPFNKPIKYDVTFRNDGKGKANSVIVTVTVPNGIQLPSPENFYVTSTVGRNAIKFTKKPTGTTSPNSTYDIITTGGLRQIIFEMKNISLKGLDEAKKDVLLRQGIISFILNTISKKNKDLTSTNDIPSCMYSDVSIVFTSFHRFGEENTSNQVTGWDLIRKNCNIASPIPPPCPRKVPSVVRPLPESVKKQLKKAGT